MNIFDLSLIVSTLFSVFVFNENVVTNMAKFSLFKNPYFASTNLSLAANEIWCLRDLLQERDRGGGSNIIIRDILQETLCPLGLMYLSDFPNYSGLSFENVEGRWMVMLNMYHFCLNIYLEINEYYPDETSKVTSKFVLDRMGKNPLWHSFDREKLLHLNIIFDGGVAVGWGGHPPRTGTALFISAFRGSLMGNGAQLQYSRTLIACWLERCTHKLKHYQSSTLEHPEELQFSFRIRKWHCSTSIQE